METKQGDIILVQYPFSDFSETKVRPAIVISNSSYNKTGKDVTVIPLTSNLAEADYSFILENKDLTIGNLIVTSRARVDRIFSVDKQIIKMKVGKVKGAILDKILGLVSKLIKKDTNSK